MLVHKERGSSIRLWVPKTTSDLETEIEHRGRLGIFQCNCIKLLKCYKLDCCLRNMQKRNVLQVRKTLVFVYIVENVKRLPTCKGFPMYVCSIPT